MVLSISGLICAGTLTRAPATETLVSPIVTWAARFGSRCQAAASLGREVKVMLPLISALPLSDLILTLPICLATLLPSNPPSASLTAPVALEEREPVTFSFPVHRRRQGQPVLPAGHGQRPARCGPADVGILKDLR